METKIDGNRLKQALEKYGSLGKAIEHLLDEKANLENQNNLIKNENAQLKRAKDNMYAEITMIERKLIDYKQKLKELEAKLVTNNRQYTLFESFVAMISDAASVENSIVSLATLFQKLYNEGWYATKKAEDLRSLFIRTVMSDYLKCFRCDNCKASFIVNKKPYNRYFQDYYLCPSCHSSFAVKADDSFLKSIVSEEQLDKSCLIETVQKELDTLKPFKAFFDLSCEICKQPITEWTELTVKRGIERLGWGHDGCFNTPAGQLLQFMAALERGKRT